jgi:pyruvate, orthophosphate dikinase
MRSTCASSAAFATHVARLDPDMFDVAEASAEALADALQAYEAEMDDPFRRTRAAAVRGAALDGPRLGRHQARLLRQAKGAPDAGLGLVVQAMAQGIGKGISGSGVIQFVDPVTGGPQIGPLPRPKPGARCAAAGGRDLPDPRSARPLAGGPRPRCLRRTADRATGKPAARGCARRCRSSSRSKTGSCGAGRGQGRRGRPAPRLRIAVALADDGIITRDEAVLRVEPRALSELLHRRSIRAARATPSCAASRPAPAPRRGGSCFPRPPRRRVRPRANPASSCAAKPRPRTSGACIRLGRVLTERGGMTSHAAVIARGLGLPCIVGASDLRLDSASNKLTSRRADGRVFREGDIITLDGTAGEVLAGAAEMLAPRWTTPSTRCCPGPTPCATSACAPMPTRPPMPDRPDVRGQGIGLCRTEHMFFEEDRLS